MDCAESGGTLKTRTNSWSSCYLHGTAATLRRPHVVSRHRQHRSGQSLDSELIVATQPPVLGCCTENCLSELWRPMIRASVSDCSTRCDGPEFPGRNWCLVGLIELGRSHLILQSALLKQDNC
jgi:hypothetical protein